MDNEPLIKAIAAAMVFLEDSGPHEVDPDSAVRTMENVAHELRQLAGTDREEFLMLIERVAGHETDERYARFIREIPFMIGMVE